MRLHELYLELVKQKINELSKEQKPPEITELNLIPTPLMNAPISTSLVLDELPQKIKHRKKRPYHK